MSTPFESWGLLATGTTTRRTVPDRFAEIKNVKDFGATGDGVTDDTAAIQAAVDWNTITLVTNAVTASGTILHFASVPSSLKAFTCTVTDETAPTVIPFATQVTAVDATTVTISQAVTGVGVGASDTIKFKMFDRGTIFFPPGHYKTTAPITFDTQAGMNIAFVGGPASIGGDVNGYVLDRNLPTFSPAGGVYVIENLNVSNSHVSGGCIRVASAIGVTVRNCFCSGFTGVMIPDPNGDSGQSIVIETCLFNSGGLGGASNGIIIGANGAIIGCDLSGLDTGIRAYGVGVLITGCRVETCNTGILISVEQDGSNNGLGGFAICSSSFESNLIALDLSHGGGSGLIYGLNIIGFNGAAGVAGTGNPTYGIKCGAGAARTTFCGITSAAQVSVAGISLTDTSNPNYTTFISCNSVTTGTGTGWEMPATAHTAQYIECDNPAAVYTVANLPATPIEGMIFDVSDGTDGLAWGATVTNTGSHTTHYRVRYNGANWTVMGK